MATEEAIAPTSPPESAAISSRTKRFGGWLGKVTPYGVTIPGAVFSRG